ncbi:MAG: BspA family leucine-rich repeat surface protein, partial [Fibrobacterota bacterium]
MYESDFNGNISQWAVGNVTDMSWMFAGILHNTTFFNQDISGGSFAITSTKTKQTMEAGRFSWDLRTRQGMRVSAGSYSVIARVEYENGAVQRY